MKEGWKIDSIENLSIQLFAGGDVPKNAFTKIKTHECNIPIYSNGIENEGLYGYTNSPKVTEPALTIAGRGTIGYVFERNTPFVPIVRLITIIPNTSKVILRYFYYALKNIDFTSSGSSIPQLTVPMIKNKKIPLPPLEEQHRIVGILDAAFAKIDALKKNAEENLKNAKALFQQVLAQELQPKEGWVEKKLGEVVKEIFAGGDAPKGNMSKTITEHYKIPIFANAVEDDGLYGFTDNARVYEPAITIAARGSGTGHVLRRKGAFLPIVRLIVIIPEDYIGIDYMYYALKNINIRKSGTAIPQLTVPMLREYKILFPTDIEEQHRIVSTLDTLSEKCRRLEEVAQQTIRECDALKQSILRQAFSGEL